MPKPITKRRDDGANLDIPSILESYNPGGGGGKPAKTTSGPTIEDLTRQLAETNRRLDEQSRANTALMSQPMVAQTAPAAKAAIEVDTAGLPDPVTETEKYNKEIAKRTMEALRAQQAQDREADQARQTQENSFNQRADALWADFQKQFPDKAEHERRVKFVAEDVARSAATRGVDVEKYMFGPGRAQYLRDVSEAYDKEWPTAQEDGDGDADGSDTRTTVQANRTSQAEDRTIGIFGGQETGGKPNKGAATNPGPAPGTLQRDLTDLQRASGYF